MIELKKRDVEEGGPVYVLHMQDGENRYNAGSIEALHKALDEFDAVEGDKALVTVGEGKFYSNGLDLDWLMSPDAQEFPNFMPDVHRLFGRVLFNNAPTAAAINGHAFAGGAMLASAHDFRVMRVDRGYFCIPEVDLDLPLTLGMHATLQARIPPQPLHEAVVTGKRWGADELVERNMIEGTATEPEVLNTAISWASAQAHHCGETLSTMKRNLYPHAFEVLLSTP